MPLPKTDLQLDIVLSEAIAQSSKPLSILLHQNVSATAVKSVKLAPWELTEKLLPGEKVYTVVAIKTLSDVKGFMLILFTEDQAQKLATYLAGKFETKLVTGLSDLEKSALKEIANILSGAILSQISVSTNASAPVTIPDLSTDMVKAALDELCAEVATRTTRATACITDFNITPLNISATLIFVAESRD